MKITICGGGHLGHVVAGFLASQEANEVRVLTRKPALWSNELEITDLYGKVFNGKLSVVTDDAEKAMQDVEMVILCLPGFSIREELEKIKPYLPITAKVGAVVGSTGFFFAAFDILPKEQPLFASYLLVAMDAEFQQLMKTLPVREGVIPTLLDYYESKDAPSITKKLHSIPYVSEIWHEANLEIN